MQQGGRLHDSGDGLVQNSGPVRKGHPRRRKRHRRHRTLVLGKCLGIPEVRVVHEVPSDDLENYTDRKDPVEATGHATVLWSGGNHFEAMVPIAPEAGRKESSGNDQGSATEFCREALDRHGKDPADDGSLADAMISFIRRHPRRTGVKERVHKPCSFRKWTRERKALTRGRASRFRIRGEAGIVTNWGVGGKINTVQRKRRKSWRCRRLRGLR